MFFYETVYSCSYVRECTQCGVNRLAEYLAVHRSLRFLQQFLSYW